MLIIMAYLGGVLTLLSPCILPVIPFLFAGKSRSFTTIALTLSGMALTFTLISLLALVGSEWAVQANQWAQGRDADLFERSIDLLISRLRQRLCDDAREPFYIKTVRSEGYVFAMAVEICEAGW